MPREFMRTSGFGEQLSRRRFFTVVTLGLGGVIALAMGVPIVAYLLEPIVRGAPDVWEDLGRIDQFPVGQTKLASFQSTGSVPWSGRTARTAVWVRQDPPGTFTVWAINCTHLGCPVNWLPDAELFECPCHGGIYYADGTVAAGPPPRPLFKHPVRVQNGVVQAKSFPLPTAG